MAAMTSIKAKAMAFKSGSRMAPPARHAVVVRSTGWADGQSTKAEKAMFGENFGARDATQGEIESGFGDKQLWHWNTDHIIKVPQGMKGKIGLLAYKCAPVASLQLVEEKDMNLMKQQVPGWRIVAAASGKPAIRQDWKLKSGEAAQQLQTMIKDLAQAEGHAPEVTVTGETLSAELTTAALGGLTPNDFIMAAKINDMNIKDLLPPPRKRFWA
mmetsp:Transcript_35315/g.89394  ORF Transcript_35315/g.89394 Transcript_35315/m.89394 type:complete len:214 (-) Transcript_35315:345-986(-)|eukprot:CAMPEP_0202873616 /NCGR_PEP_ID=MMETSP1391-20130828/23614_1 /ASSEMBLY_ACC=CAM_ASM_000867 /TAXON_ID=1034604 /ORGANISM="Chlamydomonas leiostraca, Strain SAG 11-49" /LENGTH=213 /DNA_ID=CAMNT_0049554869 /DNA_START=66 /DNA_END=707 /DNA_ORIENTATION=+